MVEVNAYIRDVVQPAQTVGVRDDAYVQLLDECSEDVSCDESPLQDIIL